MNNTTMAPQCPGCEKQQLTILERRASDTLREVECRDCGFSAWIDGDDTIVDEHGIPYLV